MREHMGLYRGKRLDNGEWIENVIKRLKIEYERAQKMEFVRNPLAYALYNVWKMADTPVNERKG